MIKMARRVGLALFVVMIPFQAFAEDAVSCSDYRDGCQDARLAKADDGERVRRIAASLGVTPTRLREAVDKVTAAGPDLDRKAEKSIDEKIRQTRVGTRSVKVDVDASQGHVVAGVHWTCDNPYELEMDAAAVAWAVGQGAPIVKTVAMWCTDKTGTKQFSGKIDRQASLRIEPARIDRFAKTRYIKLFEDVKTGSHS